MKLPAICVFLILITKTFVHGAKINFLIIADEMNSRPKTSCRSGAEKLGADIEIAIVDIKKDMTEDQICNAIKEKMAAPTLAIDTILGDTTVNRASDLVKTVARKLHMPTVSLSPTYAPWPGAPLTDTEKEYFVKVLPPDLSMAGVIRSIVSSSGQIKSFMVAHDETFAFENKVGLLFDNIPCSIALEKIDEKPETIQNFLTKVEKSDAGNIFLLGKIATINMILAKASEKQLFKAQYGWFAMTKDENEIECKGCVNGSVVFIKGKPVNQARLDELRKTGALSDEIVDNAFYYDLTKGVLEAIKGEVGKDGGWPETLTYPECGTDATEEQIGERANVKLKTILDPLKIPGVYGEIDMKPKSETKKTLPYQKINLELFHASMNGGDKRMDSKATWMRDVDKPSPANEFISNGNSIAEFKAIPMLRITIVLEPPFIYRKEGANGEVTYEGLCIDLLNEIRSSDNWNFEYRLFENKENLHGNMIPNHEHKNVSWNGMIGDLVKGSADIALGPLAVMAERETAVDFTVPYYDLVGISILMKKNEAKSSLFKFLTVLEANVWACIIGAYFFTSFLMFLFDRLSPYSYHNNKEKYKDDEETRDFSLKESLWFCITSLTPQGGGEAPRNLSGRLVAATWWLFGFIIIASYTANLAAFLTVSRLDSTIESLDDLAKQYKIKYAPVVGSTSRTYFERMANIEERFYEIWKNMSLDDSLNETERAKLAVWDYPVSDKYTKIWWTMKETGDAATLEVGINKTLDSKGPQDGFALIAESTQVRYAAMMNCQLTQVGNEFSRKPLALALPKGSEFRERLSQAILKLLNERKLETLKEKWWTNNPYKTKCYDKTKQGDGIAIENIGGVFIVIFIGIVLAILTLGIEYLYFKGQRSNTRVITVKDYTQSSKDPLRRV